jgi:hypothetical protein
MPLLMLLLLHQKKLQPVVVGIELALEMISQASPAMGMANTTDMQGMISSAIQQALRGGSPGPGGCRTSPPPSNRTSPASPRHGDG